MMLHQLLYYMMHIVQRLLKHSFQLHKRYKITYSLGRDDLVRIFHHNETDKR